MSDYLNNLVARTLNLAPVVQPRLTSLFEPSAPARGLAPFLEPATLREDLSSVEPSLHISAVNPPLPQPLSQSVSRPQAAGFDEKEAEPKPQRHVEDLEFREQSSEQVVRHVPVAVPPPFVAPLATPSAPSESNSVLRWRTPQAPAALNAQTDRDKPRESLTPLGPQVRQIEDEQIEATSVKPIRTSTSAILVKQEAKLPTMPTPRVIAERKAAAGAPQTISVTIGRVDVRAVFSQPPAPRASRAQQPAAMSLEEYLKQRSEGRR